MVHVCTYCTQGSIHPVLFSHLSPLLSASEFMTGRILKIFQIIVLIIERVSIFFYRAWANLRLQWAERFASVERRK